MRAIIQMQKAVEAVSSYTGSIPLSIHLKQFTRLHKEMGSRDRRFLQQLAFQYFRLNNAIAAKSIEEKIAIAHIICNSVADDFYTFWHDKLQLPAALLNSDAASKNIAATSNNLFKGMKAQFPFAENISAEIDNDAFLHSHLLQPYTWIRCKRNNINTVKEELTALGISFYTTPYSEAALGFDKHIDFQQMKCFEKGFFEIQDLSSQLTGTLYEPTQQQNWWDCCAASGGKSLLLKDIESTIKLMATDTRTTIIENLKNRFKKANITNFDIGIIDLEYSTPKFSQKFDGIILDAPCSGSGTWGRNPERMSFFNENEITAYSDKQHKIALNVAPLLKPDGKLVYITCSVYKQENEENVKRISKATKLVLKEMRYFKGYTYNADTMFVAVLSK
jgi:16S rRNA (cytosine967-C5)-methyltransferase